MSVKVAVDNEQHLFITCFHGRVPVERVLEAVEDVTRAVTGTGTYRGLVVFERDVNLSEWDGAALINMRLRAAQVYRDLGLSRGESAAVVNFVPEAEDVMRLWNALCAFNWDINMAFNVFWELRPALGFLQVPPALCQRVIEMTRCP